MTTDPGFVPCPRGNDNIPFLRYWCHHWGSRMKSGAFRGLEANQKKMYLLLTAKAMQGMLLQASPYQGKPPRLFLFSVFLRAASQPVCAGADAKCSSNSHSHILDVCARAHARIKDGGKLWQLWPEGSTKHSRPPSESIYADCTDALLQHQCGQQQHTQWKRSSLKKN